MSVFNAKTMTISIGDKILTGKNCIVKRMHIEEQHNPPEKIFALGNNKPVNFMEKGPGLVEITIELICSKDNFNMEHLFEEPTPKLRNKKVDDCTIQELLFSVRKKVRRGGRRNEKGEK